MAISRNPVDENDTSSGTLLNWVRRRPVLATVLLVSALSLLTLIIAWNWSALGGGKSGPKIIEGSPWEKRKASGGPKGAQSGGQQDQ